MMRDRAVVPRERHQVAERVARGLLKQAFDALDEDDLASLRAEDGAEASVALRRHWRVKRCIEVRRGEFLDSEAEGEEWSGERTATASLPMTDLPLPAGPATGRLCVVSRRVEDVLDEPGALQMESPPDVPADGPQRRVRCGL